MMPVKMIRQLFYAIQKYILIIAIWVLALFYSFGFSAFGQPFSLVPIPSSPNPVGSGARALGMGGAFIAVADDATAASWNPGGLIQLETPEISVVGRFVHRIEDNTFGTNPEASGEQSVSFADLNYLSIAYPFTLSNRNMVVSLNYQNLFDFNKEWEYSLSLRSRDFDLRKMIDFSQEGSLNAIGLAYCIEIIPQVSFGFTLNFWPPQTNTWSQENRTRFRGTVLGEPLNVDAGLKEDFTFRGFNANVGVMWRMTDRLTLGAVFKSPFTADLEHEIKFKTRKGTISHTFDEELDMPMSYGLGLGYRFSDRLTVSLDVLRTEWPDFVLIDSEGAKRSPISALPIEESNVKATHTVRLGAEYLFIAPHFVIPVRAGVFYDPAPSEDGVDEFYGFTVGSGLGYGRFIFDVAYQYRFGRDVGRSILQEFKFSQDVDEHGLYSSMIIHF